ncbi:unnamed protein product [Gordionus sp. m RMFG-2023]
MNDDAVMTLLYSTKFYTKYKLLQVNNQYSKPPKTKRSHFNSLLPKASKLFLLNRKKGLKVSDDHIQTDDFTLPAKINSSDSYSKKRSTLKDKTGSDGHKSKISASKSKKTNQRIRRKTLSHFEGIFEDSSSESSEDSPEFEDYYFLKKWKGEGVNDRENNYTTPLSNEEFEDYRYIKKWMGEDNDNKGAKFDENVSEKGINRVGVEQETSNLSDRSLPYASLCAKQKDKFIKGGLTEVKSLDIDHNGNMIKSCLDIHKDSESIDSRFPLKRSLSVHGRSFSRKQNIPIINIEKMPSNLNKQNVQDNNLSVRHTATNDKQKNDNESRRFKALISRFRHKYTRGTIDVWWLFDDGGLTVLLPFILSQRKLWINCEMRVFAITKEKRQIDLVHQQFGAMLQKFRIDYSHVIILPDIHKIPYPTSTARFEKIIEKFRIKDETDPNYKLGMITDNDYLANKHKSLRHIRLYEMLTQHSFNANLIFMTLPIPRKGSCPSALYMAWLEMITCDLNPPIFLLRGNQQSVLTFYS